MATETDPRAIAIDMAVDWLRETRHDVSEVATPLDHLTVEEGEDAIDWLIERLSRLDNELRYTAPSNPG